MYENTLVGVVVPAYNEESFIGEVIESVPEFVDRLYVIDDASTDDTWQVIQTYAEATQESEVVRESAHSQNRGRGGAVKTGYQLALVEDIDVVTVMDGDGQMDGEILDRMIDPVVNGTADYAKGNRLISADHWAEMSNWRLLGNGILTALTKVASGYYGMRDPQNGYTAVSVGTLEDISISELYEGYGFLNDMLVRLGRHNKRVVDVPMRAIYNDAESGIQYRSFVPHLSWLLFTMYLWRLWTVVRTHVARLSMTTTG